VIIVSSRRSSQRACVTDPPIAGHYYVAFAFGPHLQAPFRLAYPQQPAFEMKQVGKWML